MHLSLNVHLYEQGMLNTIKQTRGEGEHSNRLGVPGAEDWHMHAPQVTIVDSRRLPQTVARSD